MRWYWHISGGHTHVVVYMNGANCGNLCFLNSEFDQVREHCPWVQFIPSKRHNHIVHEVNQKIIDTGRWPNGKRATPEEIERLKNECSSLLQKSSATGAEGQ